MPCHGDSDDIDARDLIAEGAVLFKDGRLKFLAHGVLLEDNFWNFSWEEKAFYDGLEAREPEEASWALTDSGNYFLRDGLGADSDYLRFHCGCMGSGHGHGDQLHVDYFSHGEDILVDAGRYTYVDNDIRKRLKEPAAHNTVCIDGENFCECVDSWGYSRMALPWKGNTVSFRGWEWYRALIWGIWIEGCFPCARLFCWQRGLFCCVMLFYSCGQQGQEGQQAGDAAGNRGKAAAHSYQSRFHFGKQGDCGG